MHIIRQRGYARAGLVGNPSDGYHGKTISVIVRNFYATAILYEWEDVELILSQEDHSRFGSVDELVRDVKLHGYYGGIRLVKATIKKFADFCERQRDAGADGYSLDDRKFCIRYESNIPRQVGLAGSSAIIVATLRALMKFYNVEIPKEVQPSLVLSVEKDELGIPAGLQDRVIQIYEGLVYMDYSKAAMHDCLGYACGRYEALDPTLLPPLYIAYSTEVGEPTEVLHNPLRARWEQKDAEVVAAMRQFAQITDEARDALLRGDTTALAQRINANFDLRKSICPISPQHLEMVQVARETGASAKFAGSGGAIIGTYEDEAMFDRLRQAFGAIGCRVIRPKIRENE